MRTQPASRRTAGGCRGKALGRAARWHVPTPKATGREEEAASGRVPDFEDQNLDSEDPLQGFEVRNAMSHERIALLF